MTEGSSPALAPDSPPPQLQSAKPASIAAPGHGEQPIYVTLAPPHVPTGGDPDIFGSAADILWVVFASICLYLFRRQLGAMLDAITKAFGDPRRSLKLGPLEISQIQALKSEVESLKTDQQVLKTAVLIPEDNGNHREKAEAELKQLATRYLNVSNPDKIERIRQKDELASQMAILVIRQAIPHEWLAKQNNEGLLMALATAAHTLPDSRDAELLLESGRKVERLHVRYRFMMAVARLATLELMPPELARSFETLCTFFREGADDLLQKRIDRTLSALQPLTSRITQIH